MGSLFHNKSTTTKGKLSNMEYLTDLSPFILERVTSKSKKYIVLLVGCGRQLPRHIREAEALGFNQSEMIVVEGQDKTFETLEKKAKIISFEGQLIHGDFKQAVELALDAGLNIDCVSFDAVCLPNSYVQGLARFCKTHAIREIHFVLSTRGQVPQWTKSWAFKKGFRPLYNICRKKRCWPVKNISHTLIQNALGKRYEVNSQGYMGVSPMVGVSAIIK